MAVVYHYKREYRLTKSGLQKNRLLDFMANRIWTVQKMEIFIKFEYLYKEGEWIKDNTKNNNLCTFKIIP